MTTDEKNSQNPKDYDKILRLKRILHGIKDGLYLTAMNLQRVLIDVLLWKNVLRYMYCSLEEINDHFFKDMDSNGR